MNLTLPTDSAERKNYPLLRGLLRYFPAALAGVARISKRGNDKHNPGEEMHHARGKSMDHGDCVIRHMMDTEDMLAAYERGDKFENAITQDEAKAAIFEEIDQLVWRALAYNQEIKERFGAPLAPGARVEPKVTPKQLAEAGVVTGQSFVQMLGEVACTAVEFRKAAWLCSRETWCQRPTGHSGECIGG